MKKKKGYGLIELLVTVAIISIMSSVVLSSMTAPRAQKSAEVEARKLAAAVREAQSYALSGKQEGTSSVCGWGIYYASGSDSYAYKLFYNRGSNCGSVGQDYDVLESYSATGADYALGSGVKFNSNETKSIYFKIPYGNISEYENSVLMPSGNIEIKIVSEADASKEYSVCLYSSGMVAEKAGSGGC